MFIKISCWVNTWFLENSIYFLLRDIHCHETYQVSFTFKQHVQICIYLINLHYVLIYLCFKTKSVMFDRYLESLCIRNVLKSLWRNKCEKYWNQAWKSRLSLFCFINARGFKKKKKTFSKHIWIWCSGVQVLNNAASHPYIPYTLFQS